MFVDVFIWDKTSKKSVQRVQKGKAVDSHSAILISNLEKRLHHTLVSPPPPACNLDLKKHKQTAAQRIIKPTGVVDG
jgi:hypothetical protein